MDTNSQILLSQWKLIKQLLLDHSPLRIGEVCFWRWYRLSCITLKLHQYSFRWLSAASKLQWQWHNWYTPHIRHFLHRPDHWCLTELFSTQKNLNFYENFSTLAIPPPPICKSFFLVKILKKTFLFGAIFYHFNWALQSKMDMRIGVSLSPPDPPPNPPLAKKFYNIPFLELLIEYSHKWCAWYVGAICEAYNSEAQIWIRASRHNSYHAIATAPPPPSVA